MRYKTFISKSIAFILLLLFTQKVGAGLYLHNWLHTSGIAKESSSGNDHAPVSYSCNCIDDFAMPFTAGETIELVIAVTILATVFFLYRREDVHATIIYRALRGPPAIA